MSFVYNCVMFTSLNETKFDLTKIEDNFLYLICTVCYLLPSNFMMCPEVCLVNNYSLRCFKLEVTSGEIPTVDSYIFLWADLYKGCFQASILFVLVCNS